MGVSVDRSVLRAAGRPKTRSVSREAFGALLLGGMRSRRTWVLVSAAAKYAVRKDLSYMLGSTTKNNKHSARSDRCALGWPGGRRNVQKECASFAFPENVQGLARKRVLFRPLVRPLGAPRAPGRRFGPKAARLCSARKFTQARRFGSSGLVFWKCSVLGPDHLVDQLRSSPPVALSRRPTERRGFGKFELPTERPTDHPAGGC